MHVIWYTAMSMDGRIAGPGEDLAFLETIDGSGEDGDFEAVLADVDGVVVGGGTMRWLHAQGHDLPATNHGPVWLVSHDEELAERMAAANPTVPVTRDEGDVAAIFERMSTAGHQRVWLCGGGDLAGQALATDLVDEVIMTIAPMALGSGPALFDHPAVPQRVFTLAECREYGSGSVRLRWLRVREAAETT